VKRNGQARAGLGAASMVLILLVLCLALLGVLSLVTARADLRMSERDVELAQHYAEAAACVQQALAELDSQMAEAWHASTDDAQYAQRCMQITRAADAGVEWTDDATACLRFDAGEEREIFVQIRRMTWDKSAEKRYIIEKHMLRDNLNLEQTESLTLMGL